MRDEMGEWKKGVCAKGRGKQRGSFLSFSQATSDETKILE